MSAIAGIVNLSRKIDDEAENIKRMIDVLSHRGKGSIKIKNAGFGIFGCAPFECFSDKERQLPVSVRVGASEFVICFDGLIYNRAELIKKLDGKDDLTDAELVLNSYILDT